MSSFISYTHALLYSRDAASDKILRNLRIIVFPRWAVYFVVSVLFTFTLTNFLSKAWIFLSVKRWRTERATQSSEKEAGPGFRGARTQHTVSLRRLPLAILGGIRIISFRVTLHIFDKRYLMSETAVSLGYMFTMLMFTFCGSRNSDNDIDPRFYADRAGVTAISQLTFVIALAGKNNIISMLTGIGYEKLNILHRGASYTLLILIWVHFWGRVSLVLDGSDSLGYFYIKAGVVSGTVFTLIIILGTRLLRSWNYEFFIINHNTLSLLLLVFLHFHVKAFPGFYVYTWPPFVPWAVDRLLRLARTLQIRYLCYKAPGSQGKVQLEVLSANTLRVKFRLACSTALRLRWRAGQNAYLSVPSASRFRISLEAHPFTIATIDTPVIDAASADGQRYVELMFIIRSREGFTQRLYEFAKQGGGSCFVSAYVDGPYGEPPSLRGTPRAILIAGGSGVSFTLPLLLDLSRLAKTENTICTRVLFIWYIRNTGCIDWISDALSEFIQNVPPGLEVGVRILVTGTKVEDFGFPTLESSEGSNKKGENSEKITSPISETSSEELSCSKAQVCESPIVKVTKGRPSIVQILEDEISTSADAVSICVSGPQSLIDDVRLALRDPNITGPMNILRGGANIVLHVETFGM